MTRSPLLHQAQPHSTVPLKRKVAIALSSAAIVLTSFVSPTVAADPFRTENAHSIDAGTEAAFRAIFEQGDYVGAQAALAEASPDEPLAHAMKASLAYLNRDWEGLSQNATRTREAAEQLVQSDPLRGHLYTAVGHFLEGAYVLTTQGTVRGAPAALNKLQRVFNSLDEAKQIAPDDPELNLLQGYMDLMLAVNLPFSNPNQAIERLETYAAPAYIAQRGIALGYRDLEQQDKAMVAVDRALELAPENPELYYLKAQILVKQRRYPESLAYFSQALEKQAQLPQRLANQIAWEECRAQNTVDSGNRPCGELLNRGL
jgi:tetratricopeptide (TPR) repeat protein